MIISAGEALIDLLPNSLPTDPRIPVAGGGPMNVALTAARLAAPAGFVGRISTDAFGDQIWSHLADSGVILDAVERGDEPTATAEVISQPLQEFVFAGTDTADTMLTAVNTAALPEPVGYFHGGTLGMFRGQTASVLADFVESFDGLVTLDPNVRPSIISNPGKWWSYADRWLAQASLVRGSDEDFEWMGVTVDDLLGRGVPAVVRTLGAEGAEVALASGGRISVPAESINFVDAVGAGDSFCGALLVRLHQDGITRESFTDLDLDWWSDALSFAVRVAGITCSRPGADPPFHHEL